MIKSLRLINFFSFRDETIEFGSHLSLLVGINGSGKSNMHRAFRLLRGAMDGKSLASTFKKWGGFHAVRCQSAGVNEFPGKIGLSFTFDAAILSRFGFPYPEDLTYEIWFSEDMPGGNLFVTEKIALVSGEITYLSRENEGSSIAILTEDGKLNFRTIREKQIPRSELFLAYVGEVDPGYLPLQVIRRAILDMQVYTHFRTDEDSALRKTFDHTSIETKLQEDGANLYAVLAGIQAKQPSNFHSILEKLNDVNSSFQQIRYVEAGAGKSRIQLEEAGLMEAVADANISDGTLRFLCYMAIFYNDNRGSLVLMDEPETGLHPDMIQVIAASMAEGFEETQFIVSTHSSDFLDMVEMETVRVLEKNEHNQTEVSSFTEAYFSRWYESVSAGKLWREGELGGKRW